MFANVKLCVCVGVATCAVVSANGVARGIAVASCNGVAFVAACCSVLQCVARGSIGIYVVAGAWHCHLHCSANKVVMVPLATPLPLSRVEKTMPRTAWPFAL